MNISARRSKINLVIQRYGWALTIFFTANAVRFIILNGTGNDVIFNLDYVIPPILLWMAGRFELAYRVRWPVILTTISTILLCDAVVIYGRRFRWDADAIPQYLIGYSDLPWQLLGSIFFIILILVLISSAIILRIDRVFYIWPLMAIIPILVLVDMEFGNSRFADSASRFNIVTSPTSTLLSSARLMVSKKSNYYYLRQRSIANSITLNYMPDQILSVAVESFGLAKHNALRNFLISPLTQELEVDYDILQTAHPFYGATLQGEIRELCGGRLIGNANTPRIVHKLAKCLPAKLSSKGYSTAAIHGNGSKIYSRSIIYPAIGFQKTWFYSNLQAEDQSVKPCYGTIFRGACDDRVFHRALSLFDGSKRFVHVMTLDSHLPVLDGDQRQCLQYLSTPPALCGYEFLVRRSLQNLGRQIKVSKHKPDLIFVYGDHAPPFSSSKIREVFYTDKVPFVILIRRNGNKASALIKHLRVE